MPVTVDATVGGASANSFQLVSEIDTYFTARMPSSVAAQWTALSDDEKAAAAVMGTLWMNALVVWTNYTTTVTQALSWPRYGMWNRNGWSLIDSGVIPKEVKDCHAEISLYLAQEDRIAEFDPIKLGIASVKAGSLQVRFREQFPTMNQPPIIPVRFFNLLVPEWIEYIVGAPSSNIEIQRA